MPSSRFLDHPVCQKPLAHDLVERFIEEVTKVRDGERVERREWGAIPLGVSGPAGVPFGAFTLEFRSSTQVMLDVLPLQEVGPSSTRFRFSYQEAVDARVLSSPGPASFQGMT